MKNLWKKCERRRREMVGRKVKKISKKETIEIQTKQEIKFKMYLSHTNFQLYDHTTNIYDILKISIIEINSFSIQPKNEIDQSILQMNHFSELMIGLHPSKNNNKPNQFNSSTTTHHNYYTIYIPDNNTLSKLLFSNID